MINKFIGFFKITCLIGLHYNFVDIILPSMIIDRLQMGMTSRSHGILQGDFHS